MHPCKRSQLPASNQRQQPAPTPRLLSPIFSPSPCHRLRVPSPAAAAAASPRRGKPGAAPPAAPSRWRQRRRQQRPRRPRCHSAWATAGTCTAWSRAIPSLSAALKSRTTAAAWRTRVGGAQAHPAAAAAGLECTVPWATCHHNTARTRAAGSAYSCPPTLPPPCRRPALSRPLPSSADGDVLLHTVVDAILGALCLPDIGQLFPDTDPRWKGARR